jgi:hypothetical protein
MGDAASQEALIHRIEQHLAEQNFQVSKVQSGSAFHKTATAAIGMLIAFLLIMAILIAVVCSPSFGSADDQPGRLGAGDRFIETDQLAARKRHR